MYGYMKCPKCNKILFEEDVVKEDSEEGSCRWCGEILDKNALKWEQRTLKEGG